MGTKEKGRKEVICTQSNVPAQQPGEPKLSRTTAQGAPPNHIRPPPSRLFHWALFRPAPLQAAFTTTPTGPHTASKTTVWLVPVAGRQGSFWGRGLLFP